MRVKGMNGALVAHQLGKVHGLSSKTRACIKDGLARPWVKKERDHLSPFVLDAEKPLFPSGKLGRVSCVISQYDRTAGVEAWPCIDSGCIEPGDHLISGSPDGVYPDGKGRPLVVPAAQGVSPPGPVSFDPPFYYPDRV